VHRAQHFRSLAANELVGVAQVNTHLGGGGL
jgi:hypothetical protein